MKIKKFNETKKEETQEIEFDAKELVDKDAEPGFITDVEDQEKLDKSFNKEMDKITKFENFITINIDNVENIEVENELEENEENTGCNCCDNCTGKSGCECCPNCECGQSGEGQDMNQPNIMNLSDFLNSITNQ